MNTEVFTLPDDFNKNVEDNLIYFYENNRSSRNNKVVFTRNLLCLLQHGTKEVHTAGQRELVTNREILMLTSGSTLMSESLADNGRYEAILIFFSNEVLIDFCASGSLKADRGKHGTSIYKIGRDEFLKNYCQSLYLLRTQGSSALNYLKVREILSYIHLKYPETFQHFISSALSSGANVKLRQIVESNLNKGLSIDELAFLCNMSASTFKRHFSATYNTSPQKYFNRLKMEQAKALLSLQKKASEIYMELGYANLSAFSNEFKKHFGQSPSQFQSNIELPGKAVELLQ